MTRTKLNKFFIKLRTPSTKKEWIFSISFAVLLLLISALAFDYRKHSLNSCYTGYQIAIIEQYDFHQTPQSAASWMRMKELCKKEILEEDNFRDKELYAMFKIYDQIYQKIMPNNKKYLLDKSYYHRYLYFANRRSEGKYEQELTEFENNMSRFEQMKSSLILSSLLLNEKFALQKDPKKSLYYLQKAANLGDTPAQIELSTIFISNQGGRVLKKDIAESFKWRVIADYLGKDNVGFSLKKMQSFYNAKNIKHYITDQDLKNEKLYFEEGKQRAQIWIDNNKSDIEKFKLRRYANRRYNYIGTYEKTLKDKLVK